MCSVEHMHEFSQARGVERNAPYVIGQTRRIHLVRGARVGPQAVYGIRIRNGPYRHLLVGVSKMPNKKTKHSNVQRQDKIPGNHRNVHRGPKGMLFPKRLVNHMRYEIGMTLASSATNFQCGVENVWRLNSVFDPDLTGGTHQPYGFDQMAGLYNQYRVSSAKVQITAIPGAASQPGILVIQGQPAVSSSALTGTAATDVGERSVGALLCLDATGRSKTFSKNFVIHQLEGLSYVEWAGDQQYQSVNTTSPALTPFLRLAYATCNGSASVSLAVVVKIEFEITWFDGIVLAASN